MECNVPVYQLRSGISRQLTTFRPDTRQKTLRVEPHQRLTLVQTEETGMVTRLWLTFPGWFWQHWNPNAEIDATLLRCLILRIYFDGNLFPSVESPVGDFFGVGHCEYRQYLSRFLGMSSGGFYSYFPMPFEKGMRIEMENLHDSIPADIFLNVNYQALEHLDAQAGRFHCQFRCGENPGPEPMDVLQTEGRGHYVGCAVSMQGQEYNYLAYLEAPEYICIDQDDIEHPQIVGTGLEDYFNGGWYFRDGEFCGPYHGVPLKDTLRSMISMYRFHDQDAITFQRSLHVCFRNPWEAERLKPFRYSSTAYYYLDKASRPPQQLPGKEALLALYRTRDTDHQSIP